MQIVLVQHGEAKTEAQDPERPLTDRGVEDVERVAEWASRAGVQVAQIRHSGKRRAQQTAEILAERLHPAGGAVAIGGLKPNDDVSPVAETLASETESVMLVGHMPFLGRLVGLLVAGDSDSEVVRFRNSAIVCLGRQDGRWAVEWSVPPELAL